MPLTFNVTECADYDKHYSQPPGGPDGPVDGRIYTVAFFRDLELDDPANHGGLADPIAQFSAELQDAMDDTGLPAGFFKVIEVRDGSWGEWDQLRHVEDEPHDKQVGGKDQGDRRVRGSA